MTAPTAGLVEVGVFVRFSVVLVRFMRVRTRLPWVFDEITAPVEKQFGPSLMNGKIERAADPLRENALALLLGDVEEGKVLGAELTRGEVSEVADLHLFFQWPLSMDPNANSSNYLAFQSRPRTRQENCWHKRPVCRFWRGI